MLAGSVSQFHVFLDAKMAKQDTRAVCAKQAAPGIGNSFVFV
jgi:hypothetical protein